jgi:glycosyltransferase involved in cell wall biosynthesis
VSGADAGFVVDHGYVSHAQAVALLRGSDLLFLPMHDLPEGERTRTVPGKTYEYIASGRPILAALPAGDARDLLGGVPNTWLCRPRDVGCMVDAIRQALAMESGDRAVSEVAAPYEREELARRLAETLDRVVKVDAEGRRRSEAAP